MASISTTISLYDRITAPINNMLSALDNLCIGFEQVESSMDGGFDSSRIEQARQSIEAAARQTAELGHRHDDYNDRVRESTSLLGGLKGKIAALVGAYVGMQTVKDAIGYASDLVEVQNVVDATFGKSASSVNDWAKTTLNAFGLNEKTALQFSGTMGAMLKSSGVSGDAVMEMSKKITELSGDMASFYNLTGEEAFNKIRSGISGETEPLKQLGINMSVANLEAYAMSQGISKAYNEMSQAEQVALRYNYLLKTTADAQGDFADTSTTFSNQMKLLKENWLSFTGQIASKTLPLLAQGISLLNNAIGFLSNNWAIIEPILGGVAASIALVNASLLKQAGLWLWNSVLVPAYNAVVTFLSIGYGVLTGNTAAASAAQFVYNKALLACPLTWILLIIIAVIAAIYAVVAAINKVTDSTISATGVIVGALTTAAAFIWNLVVGLLDGLIQVAWSIFVEPFIGIIEWILNACNGGFNSFGDAVANLIGQVIGWFLSLGQVVTKIIDAIFGTNWTSGLESLKSTVTSWGKNESAITISREAPSLGDMGVGRWSYSDAYKTGYAWGEGIEDKVGGIFGGDDTALENIANTAENTGKVADGLDVTNEDLKYLREIAERDVINRFTTAEIKVDMTNNNNVSSTMDLDGIVDYLVVGVNEAMEKAAEGVHA